MYIYIHIYDRIYIYIYICTYVVYLHVFVGSPTILLTATSGGCGRVLGAGVAGACWSRIRGFRSRGEGLGVQILGFRLINEI